MKRIARLLSILPVVTVALALPSAGAARAPLADLDVGGAQAAWTPRSADYESLVLTVAGPEGRSFRREFAAGEHPVFGLFDEAGFALPDGLYKWELVHIPRLDVRTRAQMVKTRSVDGSGGLEGWATSGRSRQAGSFSIAGGVFVVPDAKEPRAPAGPKGEPKASAGLGTTEGVVVTNADGVIRNSLCVGFDCPNSPSFSDTTILMMENNTRIKFDDTSNSASFPRIDWEIEANSSLNGGAAYLGFNDCGQSSQGGCATDLVFAVESGARASALYVESDGDVGFGTSNPVVNLHVVDGNTPTLRLEQDGSSGFTPQTWDVAGNETNFFIRDATGGSQLPFRIQPGADSNSIFIESTNDVGIGTSAPANSLHVRRTNGTAKAFVEEASGTTTPRELLEVQNNGAPIIIMKDSSRAERWSFGLTSSDFIIDEQAAAGVELQLGPTGNLILKGQCSEGGSGTCADYVFEPGYEMLTLGELEAFIAENKHLPNVPSTAEIRERGVSVQGFQGRLLEKIEELTLYTLEQQKLIDAQREELRELARRLDELGG